MKRKDLKLLFVVDGRSPIALNWVRFFVDSGHEVHIASMYPCQSDMDLASLTVIPVAFSGAVEQGSKEDKGKGGEGSVLRAIATPKIRTWLRQRFVPRSLPRAAHKLKVHITDLQPDLIHAMRIPYEGMLAALALSKVDGLASSRLTTHESPLLISIWGNDFTLHAPATRRLTQLTQFAMENADALHTDCHRDQRLAREWGFSSDKPAIVLPGAGGIQLDIFHPAQNLVNGLEPSQGLTVINPRGLRAYVRNDTFFRAIPLVLARHPQTRFVCPSMGGQPEAQKWVDSLGISQAVDLLPRQSRAQMAELFRKSHIVVSPSTHDGTPNTLLEAMACGCLPVVGDIEPLREWITPGINGLLVDPADPRALADAICEGLQNPELRGRAQKENTRLIAERAEFGKVMRDAETFYRELIRLRQAA